MTSIWWYIVIGWVIIYIIFLSFAGYRKYFKDVIVDTFNETLDVESFRKKLIFLALILVIIIPFILIILFLPIFYLFANRKKEEIEQKDKQAEVSRDEFLALAKRLNQCVADHIHFDKETLSFEPDYNQVIYIESDEDNVYNKYIQAHYDEIKAQFKADGYTFCYLPMLAKEVSANEIVSYRFPQISDIRQEMPKISSSILVPYIKGQTTVRPSLIHYDIDPLNQKPDIEFTCFQFAAEEIADIKQQIDYYHSILIRSSIRLSGIDIDNLSRKDFQKLPEEDREVFEEILEKHETKKLIDEVRERVEKLHQMGVSEMILNKLFQPDNKLSRLVVTIDYRIILPDYNDMKITMTPLPKAVFFLFLRHPEGILFKQLIDYRNELSHIYNKISNRTIKDSIEHSISDITDPTNNSINEKCARIREAFINKFDERLACNYFVTGKRGEPKKIVLPRELVTWESEQ